VTLSEQRSAQSFTATHEGAVPRHVAIIPDGNRRWGDRQGLPRAAAYEQGERTIFAATEACRQRGVQWLTFFVFSTENWRRDREEIEYLVSGDSSLIYRMMRRRGSQMHERNIRFHVIGESEGIAPNAMEALRETEDLTRNNTGLNLVMAINYGGRQELVRAVSRLVEGGFAGERLDEMAIHNHLYLPDMPDVDLLIRTSGERRLSNYLMWQLAYAELVFLDVLWPEFDASHLESALSLFTATHRRFGQ
jgi:undecaprenyl diphosphate synthase